MVERNSLLQRAAELAFEVLALFGLLALFIGAATRAAEPLIEADAPSDYRQPPPGTDAVLDWRAREITRVYCEELAGCTSAMTVDECIARASDLEARRSGPLDWLWELRRIANVQQQTQGTVALDDFEGVALRKSRELLRDSPKMYPRTIWELTRHVRPRDEVRQIQMIMTLDDEVGFGALAEHHTNRGWSQTCASR